MIAIDEASEEHENPQLQRKNHITEGILLQKRYEDSSENQRDHIESPYGSDNEEQADGGADQIGKSAISYKSNYSNAIRLGRENLQTASRLLKPKKIKGDFSKSAVTPDLRNPAKDRIKKFL